MCDCCAGYEEEEAAEELTVQVPITVKKKRNQ